MRSWLYRSRIWMLTVAAGGGVFALEGCDPGIRDTVLAGVGSAATSLSATFIEAFIQSLVVEEEGAATTVRAIVEQAQMLFA